MLRRLFVSGLLLALIVVVAVPSWIAAHRTDLASPNDSDLAIGLPGGERDGRGFEAALGAAGRVVWPDDADAVVEAVRRGDRADARRIGQLLVSNREAFRAISAASEIDTETATREDDVGEVHRAAQRLVALSGAAGRLSAARGDSATAVEQATFGLRLGREFSRSKGAGLVGMMFAEAYQTRALEDLEAVVRAVDLSPAATRSLVESLEAVRWKPMDWHRAWASEYQQMKDAITSVDLQAEYENASGEAGVDVAYGLLPPGYLWQPNRTLAKTAAVNRARQRRAVVACSPQRERVAASGHLPPVLDALRPNAIGNILLDVARPNFDRYEEKRCHLDARLSLVQTLAAVKGYWLARGGLPRSLTQLVPEWLPALPRDPFRSAPLQYSEASRRVWSLGSDFQSAPREETPDPGDPTEPAISVAF